MPVDIENLNQYESISKNVIDEYQILRHDSKKLSKIIFDISQKL